MKEDIIEDLLIKYILGEANADEATSIEEWIGSSEANAKHFQQVKFILKTSGDLAQKSPLSEQQAWENFKIKRTASPAKIKFIKTTIKWYWSAAAVITLGFTAILAYYLVNRQNKPGAGWVTAVSQDRSIVVNLPDGSVVQLNKHTTVRYAAEFRSSRKVSIDGEAFFKVVHNPRVLFEVNVGDVFIKDIGTAFNVNTRHGEVEVIVESGSVKVTRRAASIALNPHQLVRIRPGNTALQMEKNDDQLYQYYRTNEFVANHTPLGRLVKILNDAYGSNIQIRGKELADIPITVTLKKESLEKVLGVILLTTPEIHRMDSGNGIILTK
ncbi:MAG TPA: FecR domain-containing protein [Mucilaginibacter sp.]|jgi:ferric-dicitrate binding protein FerR (iron transport regulator)